MTAKSQAGELSTPQAAAKSALDSAGVASKSQTVEGALKIAKNEFEMAVTSLKNLYESSVAGATYAVKMYQGADEKMAMDAAQATVQAAPQHQMSGRNRQMMSAV